jgi:hypothetical protein
MAPENSRVAILASDKVDFKHKLVTRGKEGHFILIKGAISQEEKQLSTYIHVMLMNPTSLNIQQWT